MVAYSLTKKQMTDLRLSVNRPKGIPDYNRPLSPIQVMNFIQVLKDDGLKNSEICELIDIDKSNITNYYTRMKGLIPEVQELVDWGETKPERMRLGYSAVWHYPRFGEDGQKILYTKALDKQCTRDEIRNMAQLFQRGFGTVEECFEEIINRRTRESKDVLIVGKILDINLTTILERLDADKRDDAFEKILKSQSIPISLKHSLGSSKFYISLHREKNAESYKKITSKSNDF